MSSVMSENHFFDNECSFCRAYSEGARNMLERIFLANRISYFVKWEDKSFLAKIFGGREGRRRTYVFCLNSSDIGRAIDLVDGLPEVRILTDEPEPDWSPKEKLRRDALERERAEREQSEREIEERVFAERDERSDEGYEEN